MKRRKPHIFWSPQNKVWIAMVVHEASPDGSPNYGWFWTSSKSLKSLNARLQSRETRCFSKGNPQVRFGYQKP